jgi:hypothetical protein
MEGTLLVVETLVVEGRLVYLGRVGYELILCSYTYPVVYC